MSAQDNGNQRDESSEKKEEKAPKSDEQSAIEQKAIEKSVENNHPRKQLSKRQLHQLEKLRKNPEMLQARKELQDEFLATHPRYANMNVDELRKSMLEHSQEEEKIRKQKLRNHIEAFSDGIIAVIITIMLLEIPIPSAQVSYWEFVKSVGVFLISFIVTANFWFNRHKIFALTEGITEGIIVQDFIFTGLLSLIPLLTKWIMIHPTSFSSANYGLVLVLILLEQEGLSYSITKEHFKHMPKSFKFWRKMWGARLSFTLFINIVITVIAIIFPEYGHWLFVAIPTFYFIFRMVNERENERTFEEQFDTGARAVGVPYFKE